MNITPADCQKWIDLEARRLELEREARKAESDRDLLSKQFQAYLDEMGATSLKRGKFDIAIVDGRPSVAWKDEFVKVAGAEKASALSASATGKKKIQVTARA